MAAIDDQGQPPDSGPDTTVLESGGDGVTMLPAGFVLADAEFSSAGPDLVLTAADGSQVVVRDYFEAEPPPKLITPDGAQVSGDLATRLAGPLAPAAMADAAVDGPAAQAIGQVEKLSGTATVIRADGSRLDLQVGDPLFQGDVLVTADDGAIGIVLADQTTFAMGSEGRMVLDEMVYDPGTETGTLTLSVVKGLFTFVSGEVAKTDVNSMTVETPVATIGIRGTQLGLDISDGQNLNVVLMEEAGGFVGEVVVKNNAGLAVLNQAYQATTVGSFESPPTAVETIAGSDVIEAFALPLFHLPLTQAGENDYGLQSITEEGASNLTDFQTEAGDAETDPGGTIKVVDGDYTAPPVTGAGEDLLQAPSVPEGTEAVAAAVAASDDTDEPSDEQPPEPVNVEPEEPVEEEPEEPAEEEPEEPAEEQPPEPVNVEPEAVASAVATDEDFAITGQVTATDGDADELTFGLADGGGPEHGQVYMNADGTYAYIPGTNFSGTDSFTYTVSDGQGGVSEAVVTVTVGAVADAPDLETTDRVVDGGDATPLTVKGTGRGDTLAGGAGGDKILGRGGDDLIHGDTVRAAAVLDLDIRASLTDLDQSETLAVAVGGLPEGAALSAGVEDGDLWVLTPDQLDGLTLTLPDGYATDFQLQVTAIATETEGGQAHTTGTIDITFQDMGGADDIRGGGGDDVVYAGSGDDAVRGDAGDDELYGEAGDDTLRGGSGDDVVYAGSGDDAVRGDAGDDELHGDAGDDELVGGSGDDQLYGGAGDDQLVGDKGDDQLYGGAGDDFLEGGKGDDLLSGGEGQNVYVFEEKTGSDTITDLKGGDSLRFEGKDFHDADVHIEQEGDNAILTFGGVKNVDVTLQDFDSSSQSYSVTQDGDAVVITIDETSL